MGTMDSADVRGARRGQRWRAGSVSDRRDRDRPMANGGNGEGDIPLTPDPSPGGRGETGWQTVETVNFPSTSTPLPGGEGRPDGKRWKR